MPSEEKDRDRQEFVAQTQLDEAVYTLLELGWSGDDIIDKANDAIEKFEGGDEDE
jgi:hypothetical protein